MKKLPSDPELVLKVYIPMGGLLWRVALCVFAETGISSCISTYWLFTL